jgi:hypothetical protein
MSRRETQKAIQEAYSKWSEKVEFTSDTGASNEDELKIMDGKQKKQDLYYQIL